MSILLWASLVSVPATTPPTGVHPPEVEQQLSFLVEDWTIEGYEDKYRETCSWWHG